MSSEEYDVDGGTVTASQIGRISLFQNLDEADRAEIAAVCTLKRFEAGSAIIETHGADHDVYYMIEGGAEVVNHTLIGSELHLDALATGSYFGELSALDGGPRSAQVNAIETCFVAAMSPSDFRNLLSNYPSVLVLVLHNLAQMIRAGNMTVLQHATI